MNEASPNLENKNKASRLKKVLRAAPAVGAATTAALELFLLPVGTANAARGNQDSPLDKNLTHLPQKDNTKKPPKPGKVEYDPSYEQNMVKAAKATTESVANWNRQGPKVLNAILFVPERAIRTVSHSDLKGPNVFWEGCFSPFMDAPGLPHFGGPSVPSSEQGKYTMVSFPRLGRGPDGKYYVMANDTSKVPPTYNIDQFLGGLLLLGENNVPSSVFSSVDALQKCGVKIYEPGINMGKKHVLNAEALPDRATEVGGDFGNQPLAKYPIVVRNLPVNQMTKLTHDLPATEPQVLGLQQVHESLSDFIKG